MAHKLVEQAVVAKLAAEWTHCPAFTENGKTAPPQDASAFVMVQFPASQARRMTINERRYREEGAFRLVLHVRANSGLDRLRDWSDDLAALFRDRRFGGVNSLVPAPPYTSGKPEGAYFWASLAVPYSFDFTGA